MSASVYVLNLPTALAQTTRQRQVTVPESLITELEKAAVERDHLKGIVALKDEEIAAQGQQIAALNALVSIERMRAESWSRAALERKDALVVEDKRIALYEADLTRVRGERDQARRSQKWWGFVGLVLGIGLGVASR